MRNRQIVSGIIALCLFSTAAFGVAETINLKVVTDKSTYIAGETVNWTISAWADAGANHGVSLLGVDLAESKTETLSSADKENYNNIPSLPQLVGGGYGILQGFILGSTGNATVAGQVADINVYQNAGAPVYDIGNSGETAFAEGSFQASVLGGHTLSATLRAGNYWADTSATASAFGLTDLSEAGADFTVLPEPGTMCLVGLGGLALLRRRKR